MEKTSFRAVWLVIIIAALATYLIEHKSIEINNYLERLNVPENVRQYLPFDR